MCKIINVDVYESAFTVFNSCFYAIEMSNKSIYSCNAGDCGVFYSSRLMLFFWFISLLIFVHLSCTNKDNNYNNRERSTKSIYS